MIILDHILKIKKKVPQTALVHCRDEETLDQHHLCGCQYYFPRHHLPLLSIQCAILDVPTNYSGLNLKIILMK